MTYVKAFWFMSTVLAFTYVTMRIVSMAWLTAGIPAVSSLGPWLQRGFDSLDILTALVLLGCFVFWARHIRDVEPRALVPDPTRDRIPGRN